MTDWTSLSSERTVAASPVWLRLVDTFTGHGPAGPVQVGVERRAGGRWVPVELAYLLKPNGDLVFVNLGRVGRGGAGAQFDIRVTATAPHTIAESATGDRSVVATVTTWTPDAPPAPAVQELRYYPGPDYQFGPGVPLLSGRVEDAAGTAVPRARITVTETVLGTPITEEVRTGDHGWFRLPLRWSSGSTQVDADRLGATGSATITVPADLGSVVIITLS
jgi:hypothetical protein